MGHRIPFAEQALATLMASFEPGEMMIEPNVGPAVIDALRARGHIVTVAEPWSVGRMTAAMRNPDGSLHAAATPRLMQAYAVGR